MDVGARPTEPREGGRRLVALATAKLRHAVSLALLGWYLMAPPPSAGWKIVKEVPLSQWRVEMSFETKTGCERKLGQLQLWARPRAHDRSLGTDEERHAREILLSACISTDNPELKGN
jgi:hypothetical protein